jgi:DNA polymerase I
MPKLISIDSETFLIQPGLVVPRLVCVSTFSSDEGPCLYHSKFSEFLRDGDLVETSQESAALSVLRKHLRDKESILIGQNIAYDMAVFAKYDPSLLPLIFSKYQRGLVRDTGIRQRLIYLEAGRLSFDYLEGRKPSFSLAAQVWDHFQVDISGTKDGDAWRMRYSELIDTPLADWPEEAKQYALDDAQWTYEVYQAQAKSDAESLEDEAFQVRAAFALHLMSAWGLRTDAVAVRKLEEALTAEVDATDAVLKKHGIIRQNGSKDMKVIRQRVIQAYGGSPPLTDKGQELLSDGGCVATLDLEKYAKTCSTTLEESGDPVLEALGESSNTRTLLSSFIPKLYKGTEVPLNVRYDVLKETGRTSSYGDLNVQNQPRKGGVRECYVPRPGFVYLDADYDSIELRCLAQSCLDIVGWSQLADRYQEDPNFDPHSYLGAQIVGWTYSYFLSALHGLHGDDKKREAKNARQLAKIPNFGYPGGMGADSLISFAKGYGVSLSIDKAQELREVWIATWPEMNDFFGYISELCRGGAGVVRLPRSPRVRGNAAYCAAANNYFQGPASDGMKEALFMITDESYCVKSSRLYGCRPVAQIHDQFILEAPIDTYFEAEFRLRELMIQGMRQAATPDIPITVGVTATKRWYKDAETVRDSQGRLQIWQPAQV